MRATPRGMPTSATSRRALSKILRPAPAEAPLAPGVVFDCAGELRPVEVGPEKRTEAEFRVRRLPEQEVAQAQLARSADDQIGLAHLRRVHARRHSILVELFARQPF